ncbi:hypothetical protein GOBAR_AA17299 [Gossypium barbadense]|uniref:Auxin-repressed protein n=1 Tax=Gossypium barbadense TaxID=3634 RepID=A0A2P5XJ39_GOSBA|nr:hypothetical protein GOBAR_AA17299 [Gossypium barbadense]
MGLLDQLWDDTVAGPRPDNGLGKLRKHSTFTFRSNSSKDAGGNNESDTYDYDRKIAALPERIASGFAGRIDSSGGSRESYRFRRRSTSDAYEKGKEGGGRSLAPPYDV